jgi:hypothetical protein
MMCRSLISTKMAFVVIYQGVHMLVKPSTVFDLKFFLDKKLPPNMHISASGLFPNLGFENPQLAPRIYITKPADGIWDFDFYADKKPGFAPQVMTSLTASITLVKPDWCLGVRVHGTENSVDSQSDGWGLDPSALVSEVQGGGDVFPWATGQRAALTGTSDVTAARPIADLLNRRTRIYFFGDLVTQDHDPERVNIVRSPDGRTILEVKFG